VGKPHRVTWSEVGIKQAGIRTTIKALKFAIGWGVATAWLGREPEGVEEYADVVGESRATAFRYQQAFREAYPDEESPLRMTKSTGAQDRFDDLCRTVKDRKRLMLLAEPIMFTVGGAAFAA
jgi:hypothetical protein